MKFRIEKESRELHTFTNGAFDEWVGENIVPTYLKKVNASYTAPIKYPEEHKNGKDFGFIALLGMSSGITGLYISSDMKVTMDNLDECASAPIWDRYYTYIPDNKENVAACDEQDTMFFFILNYLRMLDGDKRTEVIGELRDMVRIDKINSIIDVSEDTVDTH
jgi:hypothetical protein